MYCFYIQHKEHKMVVPFDTRIKKMAAYQLIDSRSIQSIDFRLTY